MFAYCLNNPITYADTSGTIPFENNRFRSHATLNDGGNICVGSGGVSKRNNVLLTALHAVERAVSGIDLSVSNGYLFSGTIGCWSGNVQIGIANDTRGNIALQLSLSGGLCAPSEAGFSAAFAQYHAVTNAPTVHDLTGMGYQLGGSATVNVEGVPVFAGGDFLIIPRADTPNNPYTGFSVATGVGVPGKEFHAEWGHTWNILPVINIFDILENICGG